MALPAHRGLKVFRVHREPPESMERPVREVFQAPKVYPVQGVRKGSDLVVALF